jgi:hypothetical protein
MRPRPLILSLALTAATIAGGLVIRFIPLGLPQVVAKYGGSMLWALMIYWIVSAFLPSLRLIPGALLTVGITTAVEFFKLYHSPAIDAFRLTLPGVLLLGRFFSAWDILAYWLAILAGIVIDMRIHPSTMKASTLTSRK